MPNINQFMATAVVRRVGVIAVQGKNEIVQPFKNLATTFEMNEVIEKNKDDNTNGIKFD